jgi:anti-sigma factor RsiW
MMNCQSVKPLLSDFADETLDASAMWQVQTHLSGCPECARISRDLEAMKRILFALPAQTPSAGFDSALTQRLALTRRPAAAPRTWHTKIAAVFAPRFASPAQRLRPALALGLVIAAGSFAVLLPGQHPASTSAVAVRGADPAFVAECVAQHHRDAAAEPLADLSAQTLAGSLDGSAPPDAAPSADSQL